MRTFKAISSKFAKRKKQPLAQQQRNGALSALCEFKLVPNSQVQRMAGSTGRIAAL